MIGTAKTPDGPYKILKKSLRSIIHHTFASDGDRELVALLIKTMPMLLVKLPRI